MNYFVVLLQRRKFTLSAAHFERANITHVIAGIDAILFCWVSLNYHAFRISAIRYNFSSRAT